MTEVSHLFVQLRVTEEPVRGSGIKALPTGVTVNNHEVMVGVGFDDRRHLLVPVGGLSIRADDRSQGVRLGTTELEVSGKLARFLDLECREAKLNLVFERLISDVLNRLVQSRENPPLVVAQALDEWRDLLRTAHSSLDRETLLGLNGELEVLARLGEQRPELALSTWVGPEGRAQDFVLRESAIEVKATSSVDGNTIYVSNLDQLDPSLYARLHLAVVHLRETPSAPSLDDRVNQLLELGFPRSGLLSTVEAAGYVFEAADSTVPRFETRGVRVWSVEADFPGLRSSDIEARRRRGISRVRYELSLDVAPPPLKQSEATEFLETWVA